MDLVSKRKYYKNEVIKLVNSLKDKFCEKDLSQINEYIDVDEWGLAFELVCEVLYEDSININENTYKKICDLAKDMKKDDELIDLLKKCVIVSENK